MWKKPEQIILWSITYIPLILLMVFRFIMSNEFIVISSIKLNFKVFKLSINSMMFELCIVLTILIFSYLLYKVTIILLLSGYEDKIKPGMYGKNYEIRKIKRLSVNDYSFFLLTLLLPLISIDPSSVINLSISILIIIYVISIYVKADAISSCPLFFFSGREIYKGEISEGSKDDEIKKPYLRKEAIIILKKENLTLNEAMRGEKLAGDVYYLTNIEKYN